MKPLAIIIIIIIFGRFSTAAELRTFSIMQYNVENLFDTVDDPLTADETFLPLVKKQNATHRKLCKKNKYTGRMWECLFLDWTPAVLKKKMQNLAAQIMRAPGKKGPDMLLLSEVENKTVVEQLNKFLPAAHYKVFHVDSADKRGIEQAILTRLPVTKTDYHLARIHKYGKRQHEKDLRGILEVQVNLGRPGRQLHVLALHLPSQGAPVAEREFMLEQLNKLAAQAPEKDFVVAGGDFNISNKEWKQDEIKEKYLNPHWNVGSCAGDCPGTFYYAKKKEWSLFDLLLLRNDKNASWKSQSIQYVHAAGAKHPVPFDSVTGQGESDHFPVYGEFTLSL